MQVKFVEKVVKAPPPIPVPAPPPVTPPKIEVKQPAPAAAPKAPAAAAPIIRPGQKIRKLDKPPPPKELAAPKEMPAEAPKEVDAALDKGIAVYGEGKGDVAGLEGGRAGGVAGGRIGADLAIPEDADPPVPSAFNTKPDYPQDAIAANQTGVVTLKVVILADGTVSDVEVMRGEEPFVSAALEAVKQWKYEPAKYKGQADHRVPDHPDSIQVDGLATTRKERGMGFSFSEMWSHMGWPASRSRSCCSSWVSPPSRCSSSASSRCDARARRRGLSPPRPGGTCAPTWWKP